LFFVYLQITYEKQTTCKKYLGDSFKPKFSSSLKIPLLSSINGKKIFFEWVIYQKFNQQIRIVFYNEIKDYYCTQVSLVSYSSYKSILLIQIKLLSLYLQKRGKKMDKNNLFFVVLTVHLIKGSFCNGNQQFPLDLISGMSQLVKENDIIPVARSGVFIDLIIKNQFKKLLSNLNYYSNQSSLNSVIPDLSPECDKKVVQFIKAFQQRQAWALNSKYFKNRASFRFII